MTVYRITPIVLIALVAHRPTVADFVDQEQTRMGGERQIQSYEPIGQEFTPTFAEHTRVDLWIRDCNPQCPATPLTVRIRAGTIHGPVLAHFETVPKAGWNTFPLRFTAVPADLYVIEADAHSARWCWVDTWWDAYPRGRRIFLGEPRSGDFAFRTWVVPEPTNAGMLALGLAMLARKVRSARRSPRR